MESVWWVFKQLFDKGLVYRGFKVRRLWEMMSGGDRASLGSGQACRFLLHLGAARVAGSIGSGGDYNGEEEGTEARGFPDALECRLSAAPWPVSEL
jgi:hypothetical protein